jgi:hypothetical protein
MKEEKDYLSSEKNDDVTKKAYASNTRLSIVDFNSKYINLLTKKMQYKYNSKQRNGSLYELFTSEYFTMDFIIDYLIHKEDIFIIDFLVNFLYDKFKDDTYYYLPQLCALTISKKYFKPIELFIINNSAEDLRFAISANWIFDSYINDPLLKYKQKQYIRSMENLEGIIINGPKYKKKVYNNQFFLDKKPKLEQFVNTTNFYSKLNRTCLKLKDLKPDNSLNQNNLTPVELLKKTRRKLLHEKIRSFNDDIVNTFMGNKVFGPYIGFILPFEQKTKKIIVHISSKYSFFFATKERIPIKLTMECIDAEELSENKKMDDEFLVLRAPTLYGSELDNETNVIGMESDEKKKELSKNEIAEINKILEKIKYENEHPNEQRKSVEFEEIVHVNNPGGQKNIFDPFINRWSETEKQIKEKSHFKIFNSLSIVSFIVKANDDLRQEVMTMQLIKKYNEIFKSENIPLKLHPYEIIITSNSSGLIEFIPDSISFDALKKKLLENNITITEFFENHFGDDFEESQKNFAESLAGYSLVCYLLAIKDRHNGNILLDKDGCIIHIDFGFILGISPGGNMNFENAPFKMTRDYINLMGGIDSSIFCYFKSLFLRGLFAARRKVDEIANLIEAMGLGVAMPCFNGRNLKEIINLFKERCFVKYSEVEIVPLVNNLIDRSVNSWRTTQYDYFQKLTNNIQP